MPAAQPGKELRALCHEHHIELRLNGAHATTQPSNGQVSGYICPEPGCGVRYTASEGYFIALEDGEIDREMMPRVKCASDGRLMYLTKTSTKNGSFRLWKCPECDATRTNEQGLVAEMR